MRSIVTQTIFMQILSLSLGLLVSPSAQAEQMAASGMDASGMAAIEAGMEPQSLAQAQAQADYERSGLVCRERINLFSRLVRNQGPMKIAIPFLRNFKHRERVYQGEELILTVPTIESGREIEKKVSLRCFGTSGRTEDFKPFAKIDCVDAKKEYIVGIHTVGRLFVKLAVGLNQVKREASGKFDTTASDSSKSASQKTTFTGTTFFNCQRAQEF